MIKSEAEIEVIKKATVLSCLALMEGMRSTKPGIYEYELDGLAKYIYYINGSQGDAYYSLIANGTNAYMPHYHSKQDQLKKGDLLLMDYSPDYSYYMSDITRMWPVDGKFSEEQAQLYGFYVKCYRAILDNIRPNVAPVEVRKKCCKRDGSCSQIGQIQSGTSSTRPTVNFLVEELLPAPATGIMPVVGHGVGHGDP